MGDHPGLEVEEAQYEDTLALLGQQSIKNKDFSGAVAYLSELVQRQVRLICTPSISCIRLQP
jgi:hypothetical protein